MLDINTMVKIANHDLRDSEDIVLQFGDRAFVASIEDLPQEMKGGIPENGNCSFTGYELASDLFEEGRLADCGEDRRYTFKNWELVKVD